MRSGFCLALLVSLSLLSNCQAWGWSRRRSSTSSTSSSTSSTSSGRPGFSTLWDAYPRYYTAQSLKIAMGLPDWLYANGNPNTCAIRMTKTFHDAGLGIDRSRVSSCSTRSAEVNGNGKEYIIRALFFQCYLRAIWGSPDHTRIRSSRDISNKKGVIIFTGCSSFGQHIDLWNRDTCALACDYFSRCSSVEMYYLQ